MPVVAKVGLTSHAQLNVLQTAVQPPGDGSLHPGDVAVGVKWRLTDQARVLGRFAVLPSLKFPTGSDVLGSGTGTTDVGLLLISSHTLGAVAMDLNVGYTRRSGDGQTAPRHATVWTASFGGPAAGAVGWVAELYGLPRTSGPAGQDAIVAALLANAGIAIAKFVGYRKQMIEHGIYKLPVNLKRNHISLSHTQADIEQTLEAADAVLGEL